MLKNLDSKIAIVYGDTKISYADLRSHIKACSDKYILNEAEHAMIFAENSLEWIYAFYSIWLKKGIAIPVDNLATAAETAFILNDCQPEIIFTSSARLDIINQAIKLSNITTRVFMLESLETTETGDLAELSSFPEPEPDKTAAIIYTSGTTGNPKGVMLSYGNMLTNIRAVSEHINIYKPESVVMMLLPVHHVLPLMGSIIIPLYVGGTIAISPSMASDDIMKTLKDHSVSIVIGVPRLYAAIRRGIMDKIRKSFLARTLFSIARKVNNPAFSKWLFSSVHKKMGGALESLVSGGAALDEEVGADFQTLGFEVLDGYGMTEAAPMITFTRPGKVKIGSPGEVMPETKVKIENGEILASGPNIMQGYYKQPEETALILHDGWLYTGDLGYIDKDGLLYITGRKKEIIILSNGKNVNPAEIEQKLMESPYIKECGVFYFNDQLQVLIVPDSSILEDPQGRKPDDIIKWDVIEPFNKAVSSYKKIMGFYLTNDELPKTRLGKLQRFKLASFAILSTDEQDFTEEVPVTTEYRMIASYLEAEKSRKVLPHHHLEMDLGMDSLDKVSFQAWLIQNFGISIEPNEMVSFGSVSKLSEYVAEKKTRLEDVKLDWADIMLERVNLKLPHSWFNGQWIIYVTKLFFYLYFRFKAKGVYNIPEAPVIFVPNHQSSFDGLFIASFLRRQQLRNTYFYAKEKHFREGWRKAIAKRNNIIVVDLDKDLKESIQKMAEVLRQKRNLIIFPEGTRTKTGNLGQFKKTFAILSRELNVPIVPVSIKGAFEAFPSGSKFPKPWKKIQIEFLEPVYPGTHSYDSLTLYIRNLIQETQNNN